MIFSISGKKGSGKDTAGKIINILLNSPQLNNEGVLTYLRKDVISNKDWQIKKFADKLKDIICLLIGCNREQVEDEKFKSKELGQEWWYYKIPKPGNQFELVDYNNTDKSKEWINIADPRYLIKMTPRLMLQLTGTQCGRQIIHPQIWVNSLMAEYKLQPHNGPTRDLKYPNFIITDMRFPNEMKAVEDRNGICIRINRNKKPIRCNNCMNTYEEDDLINIGEDYVPSCPKCNTDNYLMEDYIDIEHESETALDNADFQYTIENDGTIDELIDKVRRILQAEFVEMKFYNN